MPFSYVIDKDRRLVISAGSGVFTAADGLQHQSTLGADPDFHEDYCQLLDLTDVEKADLDSNRVRQLAQRTLFSPRSRRAILVNSALVTGLSRMFATFREFAGGQEQVRIFQDRDEAMRWLLES